MELGNEEIYEAHRFIIVQFRNETRKTDNLLAIDLVPNSWVKKIKGVYFCSYPPSKEFEYIEQWTKEEKLPDRSWKLYQVKLINGSGND